MRPIVNNQGHLAINAMLFLMIIASTNIAIELVFDMKKTAYPDAVDPNKVGTYDAFAHAGGGYTWDAVLEYRVWMHPERGAPNEFDGNDYVIPFATYDEAWEYYQANAGCEQPLALVLQREHINEPKPGIFEHVTTERVTEWPPEFLSRPPRTDRTIPDFFASDAPPNRLDIIRGLAPPRNH